MDNITISEAWGIVVAFLGGIIALGSAWAVIKKIPFASHEKRIKELENYEKKHSETLKSTVEMGNLLCRAMIAMLDNQITGDSIDDIKTIKKELIEYVTKN